MVIYRTLMAADCAVRPEYKEMSKRVWQRDKIKGKAWKEVSE